MIEQVAVTVEIDGRSRDVALAFNVPDARAQDLVRALGGDANDMLMVDGTVVGSDAQIAGRVARGAVLRFGPFATAHDAVSAEVELPPAATIPWVRGPRRTYPEHLPAPQPPRRPREPDPVVRPSMVGLVVPVVVAGLTALLWNPMFAVFALIAPIVTVSTWLDGQRRRRVQRRRARVDHARRRVVHAVRLRIHRHRLGAAREIAAPSAMEIASSPIRRGGRLWERRVGHDDYLAVRLGTGSSGLPVTARLGAGSILGVVGPRHAVLAHARSLLVQLANHHGPADCQLGLVVSDSAWDWTKWLPHLSTREGDPAVASHLDDDRLGECHVVLVDGEADPHALRDALDAGRRVIVIAPTIEDLPGATGLVVDCDAGATVRPGPHRHPTALTPDMVDESIACASSRAMARFEDPERRGGPGVLPHTVRLTDLLDGVDPEDISSRWKRSLRESSWSAPVGVTADGIVTIDLRSDGPHALVAGTTGSGKSEFLRTLVVALAASLDPTRCNFVLIDYKGGSAFDACAALPHTVGLVTDLDEGLATRALVCLDAELRRRERLLRSRSVGALDDLPHEVTASVAPRLVVVVDEFAAMAKELPEFVDSLVDIAQRGRSLGIHLVLATQRPAGVVSDSIRANTDLRVALRVQTTTDSRDVIGADDAARIRRDQPGRAVVRTGGTEAPLVQTAYTGAGFVAREPVTCVPFDLACLAVERIVEHDAHTDLGRIVGAITTAAEAAGLRPGPCPWPDPLPESLYLEDLDHLDHSGAGVGGAGHAVADTAVFGVVDDPAAQRRGLLTWWPGDGHVLLFGLQGSGTTTAVASLVVALSRLSEPPDVYVIGGDELVPLAALPTVGGVVGPAEEERVSRLLAMLDPTEAGSRSGRRRVLVVDGFEQFIAALEESDPRGDAVALVSRLFADGAESGLSIVATARGPGGVSHRIMALCPNRLVFSLADRYDYRALGCSSPLVDPPPGRAIDVATGRHVQVAMPHRSGLDAASAVTGTAPSRRRPAAVEALPSAIGFEQLSGGALQDGDTWLLPVGVADRNRRTAALALGPGVHGLVAGPPRSGKTTTLRTLGAVASGGGIRVVALGRPGSELASWGGADLATDDEDALCEAMEEPGSVLVLVDDADRVAAGRVLARAIGDPLRIKLVAAGHASRMRSRYDWWTATVGVDGVGVLLCPQRRDAELLGVTGYVSPLRRRLPGRGWLVESGIPTMVQVALPPT